MASHSASSPSVPPIRRSAQRAQETKDAILAAAARLFALQGFETVTMRQIATDAACSHTAIYLYFADKEALLYEVTAPQLIAFRTLLETLLGAAYDRPIDRLLDVGHAFIRFCLDRRTMMRIFLQLRSVRVDESSPDSDLNKLRLAIFNLIGDALFGVLGLASEDERRLPFSRVFFYLLYGMVTTYELSQESTNDLYARLAETFTLAMKTCVDGLRQAVLPS